MATYFHLVVTTHLFIGPRYTWGQIYGTECLSLIPRRCADFTDMTLADEDTTRYLPINAESGKYPANAHIAQKCMFNVHAFDFNECYVYETKMSSSNL